MSVWEMWRSITACVGYKSEHKSQTFLESGNALKFHPTIYLGQPTASTCQSWWACRLTPGFADKLFSKVWTDVTVHPIGLRHDRHHRLHKCSIVPKWNRFIMRKFHRKSGLFKLPTREDPDPVPWKSTNSSPQNTFYTLYLWVK